MRMILLAGMMSVAAAAANAESSIDAVKTNDSAESVDYITCSVCAPLKSKKMEEPEIVLEPGTQKIELKKVDGVLKVYRTEAWLGGSPVTYVSKASTDLIDQKSAEVIPADDQKAATITIDKNATTSAVSADMSGAETAVKPNADLHPISKDAVKVEKDTAPTVEKDLAANSTADTSDGASAKVEKPEVAQRFNPQDLQLRLDVK